MSATRVFWSYASQRDPGYYAVVVADTDIEGDGTPHMLAMCKHGDDALMIAAALNSADDRLLDDARLISEILGRS